MLKSAVAAEGFLGGLHVLLLMDDAVILATGRDTCLTKLRVLCRYCDEYGMIINEKANFFVIKGGKQDGEDLVVGNTRVEYTNQHMYLGAWFTGSGRIQDVMAKHEVQSEAFVIKLAIFCAANTQMPFVCKKKNK